MNVKRLLCVSAALAIGGTAHAALIKVDGNLMSGSPYAITSSSGSLQFDASLLSALGAVGVNFNAVAPATYDSAAARVNTTVTSFKYESTNNQFSSLTTAGGGAFVMPSATSVFGIRVGGPGNVSFTDLTINLASNTVSAFVSGANGVASGIYDIFTFASRTGATQITGAGTYDFSATGLALTAAGVNLVSQGLNLSSTGKNILADVPNLGTLSGRVTVKAVPEPATYATLGLGLIALGALARRRRAAND